MVRCVKWSVTSSVINSSSYISDITIDVIIIYRLPGLCLDLFQLVAYILNDE